MLRDTYAEINLNHLEYNITKLREAADKPLMAVVKADGYGHGVDTVTDVLATAGCRFFAVSSEAEALEVRALEEARGRHPRILILGYTFPENAAAMAEADIICAAVSILGCTCVNALESVCGVIPEIRENENGSLWFELPARTAEENGKAQILMGALRQGLSDLADEFPQNIQIYERERRKKS